MDEAQARLDMTTAQELEARQNQNFTRHRIEVLTGQRLDVLAQLDVERFVPQSPLPELVVATSIPSIPRVPSRAPDE